MDRRRQKRRYLNPFGLIDLLFNLLVGVTFLFFLAFILIRPADQSKDIESKAEFIITADWEDHHPGDVDLWTYDPTGIAVGYSAPEGGVAALERDDRGSNTDWIADQNGETVYNKINREIITIRGIHAGEWVVNLHYFSSRELTEGHPSEEYEYEPPPYEQPTRIPVEVNVKVIKLNPTYTIVAETTITMRHTGQEDTVARFILDSNGDIVRLIDAPFDFVTSSDDE